MAYFTIPVNAQSADELAQRITDNESRGFELVKTFTHETEGNVWKNSGYRSGGQAVLKYGGNESRTSYSAVMRRDNSEYLEDKRRV
ncbi:hypothetical protein [Sporosarcina sp. FA9]|uniref:hypothetical protein n=1 Tax=Sporosarcina sp. FA9 TaxID=3413030 RepID=UPI003F65559D